MTLTSAQKRVLKLICNDAKKFPHPLVTIIPGELKDSATELIELNLIEHTAGGYLLTEAGRGWCQLIGLC